MNQNIIIKHIHSCLSFKYPLACTTKEIKEYLSHYHIDMGNQLLKFLKRYDGKEWECLGKWGNQYHWRFKDGILD